MAAQIGGEEWRLLCRIAPGVAAERVTLHAGESGNEASAKFTPTCCRNRVVSERWGERRKARDADESKEERGKFKYVSPPPHLK